MSQFTTPSHLVPFLGTIVIAAVLLPLARKRPGKWLAAVSIILAVLLVADEVSYAIVHALVRHDYALSHDLPLYVCDTAAFVAAAALVRPHPLLVELTYFWALAGTLQGLLTPDVYFPLWTYDWWQFYGDHSLVVLAALLLVVGRRIYPRKGVVLRVAIASVAFTFLAGIADLVWGGNYMYLRSVPGTGSLLSIMGPWPWYIATTAALAVALLIVLDSPFWRARRANGGSAK
ncbi:MAG TPA: TIGR02206 family membrane protein [Candidatus Sulfotelmatobacter sp.]|nr:TIGR02206 family membrane protein [Candidatus Sulfotelmatobacter sp.]